MAKNTHKKTRALRQTQVLRFASTHNKSEARQPCERVTPNKLSQSGVAELLKSFSIPDFIELLEAAGVAPVPGQWPAIERTCLDRLRASRFSLVVGPPRSQDDVPPNDDPLANLSRQLAELSRTRAEGRLLNFLSMARDLFVQAVNLECHQNRAGRTQIPVAEPGQYLTTLGSAAPSDSMNWVPVWVVGQNGRLERLVEEDPAPLLRERLFELLDGADPARIRHCAYEKCARIFYAKRPDSLCCSLRCNNNRLQREWYDREAKRIDEVSALFRKGADLLAISRKTGIEKGKVRRYLQQAKRRTAK
jgi:hypothetical protein